MDASFSLYGLTTPLQILLVDLLLGADNVLLIGLACRALPPADRKRATAFGVAGAILLRLPLTIVASALLTLPLVKLIGAIVLMLIALNLANDESASLEISDTANGEPSRLWTAAAIIVVADAAMSLDNVVALAAIAQGSFLWLMIGVALSLPMLGYGGLVVAQLMRRAPGLVAFGAALLGWIAGGMAVSDALWARWAETNAPGLTALAPLFGAAFVYLHGLIVPRRAAAPRRARPRAPAIARPASSAAPPPRASQTPRPESTSDFGPAARGAEPTAAARGLEDRVMLVSMLLLALVAGGFLVFASFYGGL